MNSTTAAVLSVALPLAGVLGAVLYLWYRDRKDLADVREARARAEAEAAAVRQATEDAQRAFEALAAEALKSNSSAFLDLARRELEKTTQDANKGFEKETGEVKKLVDPLQKALEKYEQQVEDMERRRQHAFGEIGKQLENVVLKSDEVAKQAEGLKSALTRPHVRGRWGEIQLRNCVELAGMSDYCDYGTQESSRTSDDALVRPDMTVRMPAGRTIAVDAKVAMASFEEYVDAETDEERAAALIQHGRQVREHVDRLARKEYWESVAGSPDFVVMFLPNESFLYAALETQRDLIEHALAKKVLVASPPNLVGLLKVIHYGWREQRLADDAQRIAKEGRELHKRIADFMGNFRKLGDALRKAQTEYDSAAYNVNSRILTTAKRLEALGAKSQKSAEDLALGALPAGVEADSEALEAAVVEVEEQGSENGSGERGEGVQGELLGDS